jgi:hypothetical protein
LALQAPGSFLITNSSEEKASASQLPSIVFRLEEESTWNNLPSGDAISGIVVTFELSTAIIQKLLKVLKKLMGEASEKPIVLLSTSSVFKSNGYLDIVNEESPMTGLGVMGKPLTDRVTAEQAILDSGYSVTVLHLSGIVSGSADADQSRAVRVWFEKGYIPKSAFPLVNLINCHDIIAIVNKCLIGEAKSNTWKGQRVIVNAGAYRYGDLAVGLGLDPLPEDIPVESMDSFKRSKILSNAKLSKLLGDDYVFQAPVEGVLPVTQGIPSTSAPRLFEASGIAHDRQWNLMQENFRGKWQGDTAWYKRDSGDGNDELTLLQFAAYLNTAPIEPTQLIKDSEYHIYMTDADNGIWHGKGLRFAAGGEKKIHISRVKSNESGKAFQFPGMGAQISPNTSESTFAWEANFFQQRSRSMIIIMYKLVESSSVLELNSIGIAPFRCGLSIPKNPMKILQSVERRTVAKLFEGVDSMQGTVLWKSYTRALDEIGDKIESMTESMSFFIHPENYPDRFCESFDDDIVCSIPFSINKDGPCKVVTGCRHSKDFLQICTVTYGMDGKVERFQLEKYYSVES